MTNPYDPPTRIDYSAPIEPSGSASKATWLQRVLWVLSGAVGLTLGVHLVVAITNGPAEAIERTLKDPDGAVVFFSVGSVLFMLLISFWEFVRRRFRAPFVPTIASRLLVGVLFAVLAAILGSIVGDPTERYLRSISAGAIGHYINGIMLILFFVLAAAIAVEIEAASLRFARRKP